MSRVTKLIRLLIPRKIRQTLRKVRFDFRNSRFTPYVEKKNVDGIAFDFLIGDVVGQDWYGGGNSLSPEMRFIRDHILQEGDVVLECGAHHGYTTILFANWVGDKGKVVAFEAAPGSADILQANIELNNLKNVIVEKKAVSSREGSVFITDESNCEVISGKSGQAPVEATYLDKYRHLTPTFLKIDVEGFEVEVLKGAKEILKSSPKLAIEVHADWLRYYKCSAEDVFRLIDEQSYTLWIQWNDEDEPELYDGRSSISQRVHLFAVPK